MTDETFFCPLCSGEAEARAHRPRTEFSYSCNLCGDFLIDSDLHFQLSAAAGLDVPENLPSDNPPEVAEWVQAIFENRHLLSGYVRERKVRHLPQPHFTGESAENVIKTAPRGATQRMHRLLLLLAELTGDRIGGWIRLVPGLDFPFAYGRDGKDLSYLLGQLEELGFLGRKGATSDATFRGQILAQGWERVYELEQTAELEDQGFVAMSFAKELDRVFKEGIEPGMKDAGYDAWRSDQKEHVKRIDDLLLMEIRRSRFVVADVTGQSPGVYFEAGYALGHGRTVIWCCREDEKGDIHFDTQTFNHIFWKNVEDLRKRLKRRIDAVIA